jgi:ISXO2-like transposase domain
MILVERGDAARSFHIPNVTAGVLGRLIGKHAHPDSRSMTDEASAYRHIGWNFASHGMVEHGAKEYVRGDVHTNTVEGYFSIFNRGVFGVFHQVSEAHLHRYLNEFDFRYTHRIARGVDDVAARRTRLARRQGQAPDLYDASSQAGSEPYSAAILRVARSLGAACSISLVPRLGSNSSRGGLHILTRRNEGAASDGYASRPLS